jgi:hypothetical protein
MQERNVEKRDSSFPEYETGKCWIHGEGVYFILDSKQLAYYCGLCIGESGSKSPVWKSEGNPPSSRRDYR